MPHYILSGRIGSQPPVTLLRRADSANAALSTFRAEGYDDVVLHTDDAMAATVDPELFHQGVTPKEWVEFTTTPNKPGVRFWRYVRKAPLLLPLQFVGLAIIFWLAWEFVQLRDPAVWFRAFWVVIALLLASVATLFGGFSKQYDRLIEAVAWHRPEEILKWAARLRRSGVGKHLPPHELAFHEAKAFAMQGELDEALDLAASVRDVAPDWLFWAGVSEIYTCAGRDAERLAAMERCVVASSENATSLLDLAMTLVRVHGDMTRARAVLNQACAQAVAAPIRPFVQLADGMIAVQEGRAAAAIPLLEEALRGNEAIAQSNALAALINDRTRAYLALAYSQLGENQKAETYFRQAERRLQLVPTLWDLRDRCLKALRCTPNHFA